MPVTNTQIASVFDEIAGLLQKEDANRFRIRAYRNAADVIRDLDVELNKLVAAEADLSKLPSIGRDLAEKIEEIVDTGECKLLKELKRHGKSDKGGACRKTRSSA